MIQLSSQSGKPIYEQIVDQIKYHVLKGYLNPGDTLPSVRKMALEVKVTPNTVAKAYTELERQKVIETIPGKGTFIRNTPSNKLDEDKLIYIKSSLSSLLAELTWMGLSKEEILAIVTQLYDEF